MPDYEILKWARVTYQEMLDKEDKISDDSTAKKYTDLPLHLIDVVKGSYLKSFSWCHSSKFSLQGQVNSNMMTVLMEVYNNTMSSLKWVIAIKEG